MPAPVLMVTFLSLETFVSETSSLPVLVLSRLLKDSSKATSLRLVLLLLLSLGLLEDTSHGAARTRVVVRVASRGLSRSIHVTRVLDAALLEGSVLLDWIQILD